MTYSSSTEEVDLGLPDLLPSFDLQALFPSDRLLRFHPNWFVSDFQQKEKDASFTAAIKDYVTEEESQLSGSFVFNGTEDVLLHMQLTGTMNADISFLNRNNKLTVQIASNNAEIDPEDPLLLWIRAIKEYIRIYLKRTPVTLFFRVFMNKMILKMDPSQRKICLMMAKITAVELLVILLVVIGYGVFGQYTDKGLFDNIFVIIKRALSCKELLCKLLVELSKHGVLCAWLFQKLVTL